MRTIKFRGKRLDNGEWVYGNLLETLHAGLYISPSLAPCIPVDPATVGQFTGLKDKINNACIFEGDVLRWFKNRTKVVRWFLDGWTAGNDITSMSLADLLKKADCEIVGNIHDNPELLKEE